MKSIPDATPVTLTEKERAGLEVLARSQKTRHRQRPRARIVVMAGDAAATRTNERLNGGKPDLVLLADQFTPGVRSKRPKAISSTASGVSHNLREWPSCPGLAPPGLA